MRLAPAQASGWLDVEPRVLTPQDFETVAAVMTALEDAGHVIEPPTPATSRELIQAVEQDPSATSILADYGQTAESYLPLSVNARTAAEMASSPGQFDAAREGLIARQDELSPEAFSAAIQRMDVRAASVERVTEESVALAAKYAGLFPAAKPALDPLSP